MQYEEALQRWGAARIERDWSLGQKKDSIDPATVTVTMDFNPGLVCCAGKDPDCYCSLAEEPSASVTITGQANRSGRTITTKIEPALFNFSQVLAEIIAAGDGVLINQVGQHES